MGLLNVVKNLFTEEVEVEDTEIKKTKQEKKQPIEPDEIQKEVIQVEIPSPTITREELHNISKEEPKKEEYKFPFFDDKDFDTIEVNRNQEEKKEKKEIYKKPKEEKKVFKPSPIISPVYGFLDKNYQKEELVQKTNEYNPRKATVDEIRDRAYGSLESDIETTLFGNNRVLFDEESKNDVFEEEIKNEEATDDKEDFSSKTIDEKPRHENVKDDDDLTELLEAEMAKTGKDAKTKRKPRKISDKELFSLIDSMYEKEIK